MVIMQTISDRLVLMLDNELVYCLLFSIDIFGFILHTHMIHVLLMRRAIFSCPLRTIKGRCVFQEFVADSC